MKKTILFFTFNLSTGGAEKILTHVANTYSKSDFKVIIASAYDKILLTIDKKIDLLVLQKEIHEPKARRNIWRKMRDIIKIVSRLRLVIKKISPDIVCSFGVRSLLVLYLANVGFKKRIITSERRSPYDLTLFWKYASKFLYSRCEGVVFQLEEARNFYSKKICQKSWVIPNPYLSKVEYPEISSFERSEIISSGAARLEYDKGFDVLIDAFSIVHEKHPNLYLIIFGDGNIEKMYGEQIRKYNLVEYISFPGVVQNVVEEIYKTSLFVLPSRNEGIPNILLEVMGAGVPVVASDCKPGGPRLLTNNGERGILVEVGNSKQMAYEICKIIESNEISDMLSKKAREVKSVFNENIINNMWIDFLNSSIYQVKDVR
jgi:glycosyltransferase involved in cell wall biosynthesis